MVGTVLVCGNAKIALQLQQIQLAVPGIFHFVTAKKENKNNYI